MTRRFLMLPGLALVFVAVQCAAAMAIDPRIPNYEFKYSLYATGASALDYLKIAKDFADCMVKYGRDRYGKVICDVFGLWI